MGRAAGDKSASWDQLHWVHLNKKPSRNAYNQNQVKPLCVWKQIIPETDVEEAPAKTDGFISAEHWVLPRFGDLTRIDIGKYT